jgi:hypothetical protein
MPCAFRTRKKITNLYVALRSEKGSRRNFTGLQKEKTMTAITFGAHAPAPTTKTEIGAARGFWARAWEAFVEARMRSAMRDIRMHRHLLPADLEIAGNRISYKNEDQLPFVRARD